MNGSTDLTQVIDQYLSQGLRSGSVSVPNPVTLGSFLTASNVTVGFNITQGGPNWTGSVTVSADSASVALGQEFSAQVQGDTQQPVGLSGTYTLNNQPFSQGAYSLTATDVSASVSNLLTATAKDVELSYDPAAPAG
jgi:hypothetical protein